MQQLTNTILSKAAGVPVVAFDVFGTLLNRDVQNPTDLFVLMEENGMAEEGFCAKRIRAEQDARSETDGEVTLSQIYAQKILSAASMEDECQAELTAVVANSPVFDAAVECHRQGKKVFAISDMYLPKQQLNKMLLKCGYDFLDGIFVSSEYGVQKRSGKLFELFLAKTKLKNTEVYFVGDDFRADVCGAALAGIRAFRLPFVKHARYMHQGRTAPDGALYSFVNNRLGELSPLQQIGYEVLGPLAVGFAQWLHSNDSRNAEDTIKKQYGMAWLARDMYCMQQVYELLFPSDSQGIYLKVSRKSLIPALLRLPMNEENVEYLADALPREILSVRKILDYCGITRQLFASYPAQMTIDLQTRPLTAQTSSFLKALVAYNITELGHGVTDEGRLVRDYLHQNNIVADGMTLVDIGSGGTTQRLLEKICGIALQGKYLACDERLYRNYNKQNAQVFLFGGKAAPVLFWAGQQLLEKLISEPCGSTNGYRCEGNEILPVTEDASAEDARMEKTLVEIQKGIYRFARDWAGSFCGKIIISPERAIAPFLELISRPRLAHARLLGSLTVEDGEIYPLARPKSKRYYFTHPKKLASDFSESRWKMGFMKRLCRVPLPYGKLYTIIKSKRV